MFYGTVHKTVFLFGLSAIDAETKTADRNALIDDKIVGRFLFDVG